MVSRIVQYAYLWIGLEFIELIWHAQCASYNAFGAFIRPLQCLACMFFNTASLLLQVFMNTCIFCSKPKKFLGTGQAKAALTMTKFKE